MGESDSGLHDQATQTLLLGSAFISLVGVSFVICTSFYKHRILRAKVCSRWRIPCVALNYFCLSVGNFIQVCPGAHGI